MQQKKCLKCGYTWVYRTESPKKCPKCYNRKYNEDNPIRNYDKKIKQEEVTINKKVMKLFKPDTIE